MRFASAIVAFALSLACASACWFASNQAPLGTMIGGLIFAAIIVPPIVAFEADASRARFDSIAYALGTSIVWLLTVPIAIALPAGAVFVAFVFVLATSACSLKRIAKPPIASTLVTLIALAWLTWPIWFSEQPHARMWTEAHPIFAINGISPALGVWTQLPVMYRLTALGQDVPYTLPTTIAWTILLHLAIAVIALANAGLWKVRSSPRSARALG